MGWDGNAYPAVQLGRRKSAVSISVPVPGLRIVVRVRFYEDIQPICFTNWSGAQNDNNPKVISQSSHPHHPHHNKMKPISLLHPKTHSGLKPQLPSKLDKLSEWRSLSHSCSSNSPRVASTATLRQKLRKVKDLVTADRRVQIVHAYERRLISPMTTHPIRTQRIGLLCMVRKILLVRELCFP